MAEVTDEVLERTMLSITIDWLASLVNGNEWSRAGAYRRNIVPEIDPIYEWINKCWVTSGEIPEYRTVASKWPRFKWPTTPLPVSFAELELQQAYRKWLLHTHVNLLHHMLTNGTVNQAWDEAVGFVKQSMSYGSVAKGAELTDPSLYLDVDTDILPVQSWGPVMENHPLRPGHLALLAARTGVGKSYLLLMASMDAVKLGWDVVMYSLEMPRTDVAHRLQMLVKPESPVSWIERQIGKLWVIEQGDSRTGHKASDIVKRVEQGARTMVVVDYGELMRPDSGGRSSENWNKSAEISEVLQSVTKYLKVPVLAAVQDNRQATTLDNPGTETLSGTDRWGRDADLIVRLRDEQGIPPGTGPTRVLSAVKTRHSGRRPPSYFHFDPEGDGITTIDRVAYVAANSKYGAA